MFKRVLAIGDIHGNYNRLMSLWKKINYNDEEDFLIFLGDYIDRGKDSIKVLEFIMDLKQNNKNIHCLFGNHELMFMDYYDHNGLTNNVYEDWIRRCNGGDITLEQFQSYMIKDNVKMNKIIDFIYNLDVYNEDIDEFFFVHAGIDPTKDIHQQSLFDLVWIREDFYEEYEGDLTFVVGHTPVQTFDPSYTKPMKWENNIILLDTGSFLPNGKITCMDVLTEKIWQSD